MALKRLAQCLVCRNCLISIIIRSVKASQRVCPRRLPASTRNHIPSILPRCHFSPGYSLVKLDHLPAPRSPPPVPTSPPAFPTVPFPFYFLLCSYLSYTLPCRTVLSGPRGRMLPHAGLLAPDSINNTHSSTQLSTLAYIKPSRAIHVALSPYSHFSVHLQKHRGEPYFSLAQFDHFLAFETQDGGSHN